jgi:hypothetical protein
VGASGCLIDERRARARRRESRLGRGGSEEGRVLTETLRRAAALVTLRCRGVRGDVRGRGLGAGGQHWGPRGRRARRGALQEGQRGRDTREAYGSSASGREHGCGCFGRDASEEKRKSEIGSRLGTRTESRPPALLAPNSNCSRYPLYSPGTSSSASDCIPRSTRSGPALTEPPAGTGSLADSPRPLLDLELRQNFTPLSASLSDASLDGSAPFISRPCYAPRARFSRPPPGRARLESCRSRGESEWLIPAVNPFRPAQRYPTAPSLGGQSPGMAWPSPRRVICSNSLPLISFGLHHAFPSDGC